MVQIVATRPDRCRLSAKWPARLGKTLMGTRYRDTTIHYLFLGPRCAKPKPQRTLPPRVLVARFATSDGFARAGLQPAPAPSSNRQPTRRAKTPICGYCI